MLCDHFLLFQKSEIRLTLEKQENVPPQARQQARTQQGVATSQNTCSHGVEEFLNALISQYNISQAAPLLPGSWPMKTKDTSQLEIQRHAVHYKEKNER